MISDADVQFYRENGYLVVPAVLDADDLARVRAVTDEFVQNARHVSEHTDVYDLEDTHSAEDPRVRRIKTPHMHHPEYARLVRHPRLIAVLQRLIGESVRFDTSKLNMKAAGFGAPVEWHQDWAFYPHTNDDLLAVGIMLDDCEMENGPLMVIPGSHRGPVYDHHADGYFCGAMDLEAAGLRYEDAVALTGKAGSVTIHHVRTVHGSAPNRSSKPRRLLLHQYCAGDAWPLLSVTDFNEYNEKLITGTPSVEPRLEPVPVRLPLPPAKHAGSIYENQRTAKARFFDRIEKQEPVPAQ